MDSKLLFFDFNGVISYNNFWHPIYEKSHPLFSQSCIVNDFVFKENLSLVKDWMVGRCTSEDIHALIEETLGIKSSVLFPIFEEGARHIDISEKILLSLQDKKSKGYRIVMVTDNMDSFPRFTRSSNRILDDTFDAIFDSYSTGLLKKTNEGEIFKKIASIFAVPLKNSYLFDDSGSNCDLFNQIGGKSIQVTGIDNVLHEISKI